MLMCHQNKKFCIALNKFSEFNFKRSIRNFLLSLAEQENIQSPEIYKGIEI